MTEHAALVVKGVTPIVVELRPSRELLDELRRVREAIERLSPPRVTRGDTT